MRRPQSGVSGARHDHVDGAVHSGHVPSRGRRPVGRVAPADPPVAGYRPGGTVGCVDTTPGPDPGDADPEFVGGVAPTGPGE